MTPEGPIGAHDGLQRGPANDVEVIAQYQTTRVRHIWSSYKRCAIYIHSSNFTVFCIVSLMRFLFLLTRQDLPINSRWSLDPWTVVSVRDKQIRIFWNYQNISWQKMWWPVLFWLWNEEFHFQNSMSFTITNATLRMHSPKAANSLEELWAI